MPRHTIYAKTPIDRDLSRVTLQTVHLIVPIYSWKACKRICLATWETRDVPWSRSWEGCLLYLLGGITFANLGECFYFSTLLLPANNQEALAHGTSVDCHKPAVRNHEINAYEVKVKLKHRYLSPLQLPWFQDIQCTWCPRWQWSNTTWT